MTTKIAKAKTMVSIMSKIKEKVFFNKFMIELVYVIWYNYVNKDFWAFSSAGERCVHIAKVEGSIPSTPTTKKVRVISESIAALIR